MSSSLKTGQSRIQDFYSGKTVLMTGGTGFLGKVLVEKMLRSCPDIQKIYFLVREKNGLCAEERLNRLLDDLVFSRLKKCNPSFAEKLAVVHGDLCRPRLGLDQDDVTLLTATVEIVIHSAATVSFDEKLGTAIAVNVTATRELCFLAQEMNKLKAFVYLSTAFSNCEQPLVPEKICPPPICPEKMIRLAELLDNDMLDKITPPILSSKPNTYLLTKCVAEELVRGFKKSLPVAILRPSIVLAAVSEPFPGWVDCVQGPTGVAVSTLAGMLRTVRCKNNATANIVPVDYTANSIIALAYAVATKQWHCPGNGNDVPVVNFVSLAGHSMSWGQFRDKLREGARKYPSARLLWYPTIIILQGPWTMAVCSTLLQRLPAKVMDFLTSACGKPTRFTHIYKRLDKYLQVMTYFSTRHFEFEHENAALLWEMLEPQDKQMFPFNMAHFDWTLYFSDYIQGCRQYILRERPQTLSQARRRLRGLYLVHFITKGTFVVLALRLVMFLWTLVRRTVV